MFQRIKILISAIFLFSGYIAHAQKYNSDDFSTHAYIYKLTNAEALFLYQNNRKDTIVIKPFFHDLIGTFTGKTFNTKSIKGTGHFLKVSPDGYSVNYEVFTKCNIKINSFKTKNLLEIQILDTSFRQVYVSRIFINKNEIKADADSLFRIDKNIIKNILLEVPYETVSFYYTITPKGFDIEPLHKNRSNFKWASIIHPLKVLRKTANKGGYKQQRLSMKVDLRKNIHTIRANFANSKFDLKKRYYRSNIDINQYNNDWISLVIERISDVWDAKKDFRRMVRQMKYEYGKRKPGDDQNYRGYIALNKPKYKPGDTLKAKAHIVDKNYANYPTTLLGFIKHYSKAICIGKISPTEAGSFIVNWPIPDSLRLNETYTLELRRDSVNTLVQNTFKYEEYVLKETFYSFKVDKKEIRAGEKQRIFISVKDINDLPVFDAKVSLHIITNKIDYNFSNFLFIPDTLFRYRKKLDLAGETVLEIPDSVHLNADYQCKVIARLTNTIGEVKDFSEVYRNSATREYLKFDIQNEFVQIDYVNNNKYVKAKATLTFQYLDGDTKKLQVDLPYKEKINPNVTTVSVDKDKLYKSFNISSFSSLVSSDIVRDFKNTSFVIRNPRKLKVHYETFINGKEHIKGDCFDNIEKKISLSENDLFAVKTKYFWAGRWVDNPSVSKNELEKNVVDIQVEQPGKITPGKHVSVNIKVKDYQGRPVQGMNLTAWGINKQFETNNLPTIPYFGISRSHNLPKYDAISEILKFRDFGLHRSFRSIYGDRILTKDYYYDFLFPKSGKGKILLDTKDFSTQCQVFVFDSAQQRQVYYVMLDQQIAYSDQYEQTNYDRCFYAQPGWHSLKLRTYNKTLELDSIFFEPGKKNIFSFNLDTLDANVKWASDKLSKYEMEMINNSSLVLQSDNYASANCFLKQGDRHFELYANESVVRIGPVKKDSIHLFNIYGEKKRSFFPLDTIGFLYTEDTVFTFNKKSKTLRENLYENGINTNIEIPIRSFIPPLDSIIKEKPEPYVWERHKPELIFMDSIMLFRSVMDKLQSNYDLYASSTYPYKYNFTFDKSLLHKYDINDANIFIQPKASKSGFFIYSTIAKVIPGAYRYVIIKGNEFYRSDFFEIKPNGMTFMRPDTITYQKIKSINELLKVFEMENFKSFMPQKLKSDSKSKSKSQPAVVNVMPNHIIDKVNKISFNASSGMYEINGTVMAGRDDKSLQVKKGEPLIGAPVKLVGTAMGTVTNVDGEFKLRVKSLKGSIVISYSGFKSIGIQLRDDLAKNLEIYLIPSEATLDEVVVMGYGTQKTSDVTGAVKRVSSEDMKATININSNQSLQGRAAGVNVKQMSGSPGAASSVVIRGLGSPDGTQPLYVIDGIEVESSDINMVNPSNILKMDILKDPSTAIYGSRGSNGVVIITTKNGSFKALKMKRDSSLALVDSMFSLSSVKGKSLRTLFRDYAFWQPELITDKNGEARFNVVFPDNLTAWNTYVCGMDNKRNTGMTSGEIRSFKPLAATLSLPRFLIYGDSTWMVGKVTNYTPETLSITGKVTVNEKETSTFLKTVKSSLVEKIQVLANRKDSLPVKFEISTKDDYSDGEKRTIPVFEKGVITSVGFKADLVGDTIMKVNTTQYPDSLLLYACVDRLDLCKEEINKIRNHKNEDNEALASKLKAYLFNLQYFSTTKETPEKESKEEKTIKKIVAELAKRQLINGGWAWRQGIVEADLRWTLYITKSMLNYQKQGYNSDALFKALQFIQERIAKARDLNEVIASMKLISSTSTTFDYTKQLKKIDYSTLRLSEKLDLYEIKRNLGQTIVADSIMKYRKISEEGSYYWGEYDDNIFENSLMLTQKALGLLKSIKANKDVIQKTTAYLFQKRNYNGWRNTFESAIILETILPILAESKETSRINTILKIKNGKALMEFKGFPFFYKFKSSDSIKIEKTGVANMYLSLSGNKRIETPKNNPEVFEIETMFLNAATGKKSDTLKVGEKAQIIIDIKPKKKVDYVEIEVPIPAGCYFDESEINAKNNFYTIEYKKDKAVLYFERLMNESYRFKIGLEPRFKGIYYVNPTKAELVYFPTKSGNNELKKITINE